jgi:hypothetical protein
MQLIHQLTAFVSIRDPPLQVVDNFDDREAVVVPESEDVIVARFLPFVKLVAILDDKATQDSMVYKQY